MHPPFMANGAVVEGALKLRAPSDGEALVELDTQTITASGTITLVRRGAGSGETRMASNVILFDCNGADRTLKMPVASAWSGEVTIRNISSGAYTVAVQTAAAVAVGYIDQGEAAKIWSLGTGTSIYMNGMAKVTASADDFGVDGIKTDVINESTAAAGVTVDGVVIKDGGLTVTAHIDLGDSDLTRYGDSLDVTSGWDGTDFDWLALADDTVMKFGNGTNNFDLWFYGNIATAYMLWDASASELSFVGPVRAKGMNTISPRFELKWVAGASGLPQLNAVADAPAADTYNTAATQAMYNADRHFEILGTNASSDDVTFYAEGGIKMETDGADGDEVILLPHLNANQTPWTVTTWGTDKQTIWECHIKTGSAITSTIIWAGLKLTNTEVKATDNDQVYFRYESDVAAGNWEVVDSVGGVDTSTDTTVVAAVDTELHLKIVIAADRTARCYLNGALVRTTGALTNATDLIPYIGVAADGAAAATHIYVFGQSISRAIG